MPSPPAPAHINARRLTSRSRSKRKVPNLPPRIRQLVELMVYGTGDDPVGLDLRGAAEILGISLKTARNYMTHARAKPVLNQLAKEHRANEYVRNTYTAIEIRDSLDLKDTAAGQHVRLKAAKFLESDEGRRGGVNVNVGVNVTPGYVIDLTPQDPEEHRKELERLGLLGPFPNDGSMHLKRDAEDAEELPA